MRRRPLARNCHLRPARRPRTLAVAPALPFHIIGTMKEPSAITALSALASEARLGVFRLLVRRGPQGFTPSELAARLKIPAPTLSFHLKELLRAGLIVGRREGRNLFYSPDFEHMNSLVAFLTENCCTLADDECDANCQPIAGAKRKRA
jgi:ArsR family transcriptional regulator